MTHPDLPAEQAYFDAAYDCLDRMRDTLLRTAHAGATEEAQQAIEDWATGRLRTFEDAERGLCFGRIDAEGTAEALYVGRRWVHDDARRALVVNWQAPAGRGGGAAAPAGPPPGGRGRRRRPRGRSTRPRRRHRTA